MRKLASLLIVSILGGALTLGSYKLFFEEENVSFLQEKQDATQSLIQANYDANRTYGTNVDFTAAAEKTVHAVVHVKNVAVYSGPRSWADVMQGKTESSKALRGTGSGVIITPDGYIVTNNHVIDGANELEVTLNNNKTYKAKVIGTDAISDIALIKVEPEEDLEYIPFGNSNNTKVGEWVLAVGNPFNLKSTVTAGIISAKSRNLNFSFICCSISCQFSSAWCGLKPGWIISAVTCSIWLPTTSTSRLWLFTPDSNVTAAICCPKAGGNDKLEILAGILRSPKARKSSNSLPIPLPLTSICGD